MARRIVADDDNSEAGFFLQCGGRRLHRVIMEAATCLSR